MVMLEEPRSLAKVAFYNSPILTVRLTNRFLEM
jgi:hypothetical protein